MKRFGFLLAAALLPVVVLGCAATEPAPPGAAVAYTSPAPAAPSASEPADKPPLVETKPPRDYTLLEIAAMNSAVLLVAGFGSWPEEEGLKRPPPRTLVTDDRRATLEVYVADASGAPLAGAVVCARGPGLSRREARTDSRGVAVFWLMWDGTWRLRAGGGTEASVSVPPGRTRSVTIIGTREGGVPCDVP